jgi:hypothetical protein
MTRKMPVHVEYNAIVFEYFLSVVVWILNTEPADTDVDTMLRVLCIISMTLPSSWNVVFIFPLHKEGIWDTASFNNLPEATKLTGGSTENLMGLQTLWLCDLNHCWLLLLKSTFWWVFCLKVSQQSNDGNWWSAPLPILLPRTFIHSWRTT